MLEGDVYYGGEVEQGSRVGRGRGTAKSPFCSVMREGLSERDI